MTSDRPGIIRLESLKRNETLNAHFLCLAAAKMSIKFGLKPHSARQYEKLFSSMATSGRIYTENNLGTRLAIFA